MQRPPTQAEIAVPAHDYDVAWLECDLPWNVLPPDSLWQAGSTNPDATDVVPAPDFAAEVARQVLLVRTTWRRNFSGLPFLASANQDAIQRISQRGREWAFQNHYTSIHRLAELSPRRLGIYRERLILPWQPVTLPLVKPFKSIAFSSNTSFSAVRLGEAEHVQVVQWQAGWQSHVGPTSLETLMAAPDMGFALSTTHGFLTSDPAWAGPGIQIEVVVHLPALMAHRKIQQAQEGLHALGLFMHPEPLGTVSGQDSGFFRISSRGGLGLTAPQLRSTFWEKLKPLLFWEKQTRDAWWKRDPLPLRDRIRRSLRMLSDAQLLPLHEALVFAAFVRLGAVLGELEKAWLLPAEKVRITAQSAHLGVPSTAQIDRAAWQKQEDAIRAEKIRSWWKLPE